MPNSKSKAGTKVQQRTNTDVTTSSSHNAKPNVSSSAGYVIAKCPNCKNKKRYDMDKPLNHTPMCDKCFMCPMIVDKVVC